ncbi:hypothetical protein PHYPSEUDO_015123 [Phytophthora pseudosyringae]|uniref:Uncharacterized protein n=1 Tax=Phytophthora pseudosyringae TaxID=221518 RepID=A0A8T1W2X9_9STRA|nr:hypothetical protein PHYPSEUDO_015123 [Phytophthora pseudosyringae]
MPKPIRRPLPPSPPSLASVAFVSRQWPRIEALDHVTRELDALLDHSQLWTLAEACGAGHEHLVERIAARDAAQNQRKAQLQRQALATTAMASAAAGGHVAVLRRLAALFPGARVTKAVEAAARNGHVHVLQWLHEQQDALDVFWGAREMLVAVRNGHLDAARWLHRHTTPPEHQFLIDEAARCGDLAMIRWLHSVGAAAECSVNAAANAAENGHLETLKWLTEHCFHHECPEGCSLFGMNNAVGAGRLDILQWLHSNYGMGCNSRAMEAAASGGHFDILDFLHREGLASCSADVSIKAVAEGHLEILEYLFQHYPESIPSARLLRIAKRHDLYCVDWLVRTGKAVDYETW